MIRFDALRSVGQRLRAVRAAVGPQMHVMTDANQSQTADDLVKRLGIRVSSVHQLAGELSGGNQQKVSLAKWLAADTRMLVIAEPTVGVDIRTKRTFHELIWELARDGLAILLISSDLGEMVTLADRVIVMGDYRSRGEVENDHDYPHMSGRIIRLIHGEAEVKTA